MEDDTKRVEQEPKIAKQAGKECPKCGATMEKKDGEWVCPKCGHTEKAGEEPKMETVEDLTKDVAEEISKMVKAEVAKISKTPMRKALADDTLGGDEAPKERKKAKNWFQWFRKFHGTIDEEGDEWWQQ